MNNNVSKVDDGIIIGYVRHISWGIYKLVFSGNDIKFKHINNVEFLSQEINDNMGRKAEKDTISNRIDNLIDVIKQLHSVDGLEQGTDTRFLSLYAPVLAKRSKKFVYKYLKYSSYKKDFDSNVEESLFDNDKFSTSQLKRDYKEMDTIAFLIEYKYNCQKHEDCRNADAHKNEKWVKMIDKVQESLLLPLDKFDQMIQGPLGWLADKVWLKGHQQDKQGNKANTITEQSNKK